MPLPASELEPAPPPRPARPNRPIAPSISSIEQLPPTSGVSIPTFDAAAMTAQRGLHRKRTLIPILLTCGALLLATGGGRWVVSEDSAFRLLGAGASIAIASAGGLLIAVAALNMLQVRDQLAAEAAQRPHPDPV
jgi:hypothetical protein